MRRQLGRKYNCIGEYEEDQLPAEHVDEAFQLVNDLLSPSVDPDEKSGLEKVKRALEVAKESGVHIEFDH